MIAVGELQKSSGPDQRTTATADLAARNLFGDRIGLGTAPANNDPLGQGGRGLTAVHAGTRYWTGVWGNRHTAANAFTDNPSPALLNWLVSGNHNNTEFTPGILVDWSTIADFRLNLAGGSAAIVLVGPGTTGSDDQSSAVLSNFGITSPDSADIEGFRERFVVAPAVPVIQTQNGASVSVGNYAFWIGDEGVKARINLPDRYAYATDGRSQRLRARVAQRIAGELSTAAEENQPSSSANNSLSATPTFNYDDYPFPGNRSDEAVARLPAVLSLPQFELLREPAAAANDPERLQRRFHSLSSVSRGVPTDSLNGGLKQDLNLALADPGIFNMLTTDNRILPAIVSPTVGPNWNTIRDFHQLALRTNASINLDASSPGPATPAPVITGIRLLFKLYPNRPVDGSPPTWHIRTNVLVGIGNPYTARLDTSGLHLVFDRLGQAYNNPSNYFDFGPEGAPTWGSWWIWALNTTDYGPQAPGAGPPVSAIQASRIDSFRVIHRPGTVTPPTSPWSLNGSDTAFLIPATSWAPGEIRYFAVTDRNQSVTNTIRQQINLSAVATGPLETHFFSFDTGVSLPADDDPDTSEYFGWLQMHHSVAGWGARYNPTGFAAALYRPTDSPLNSNLPLALTRVDISTLYSAGPHTPTGSNPDDEGSITAGVLKMQTKLPLWTNSPGPGNYSRYPHTFRPFADHNIRARFQPPNPLYRIDLVNAYLPFYGLRHNVAQVFTDALELEGWGGDYHGVTSASTFTPFDLPFRSATTEPTFLSLGELQHVDLTANDDGESIGYQPGAAVGNSFYVPLMRRELSIQTRNANFYNPPRSMRFFDMSYLLNTALFDRFFFSSYGGGAVPNVLPNTRYTITSPQNFLNILPGEAVATSPARSIMIKGAFNVNSTSMEAWAAVLGSTIRVPVEPDGNALNIGTAFPRSINQPRGANRSALGNDEDTYGGFRRLTDDEVRDLSREMVRQVRQRGPFLSLSQFVNRTLVAANASGTGSTDPLRPPASMGLSGPLQSAIDAAGINNLPRVNTAVGVDHPFVTTSSASPDGFNNAFWPDYERDFPALQAVSGSTTPPPQGNRFSGVPGFLTQADVLQVLAPTLSTRSDTFRIRAYGETINPDGSRGARAWCEAIVQRRPEFVDPSNPPGTPSDELTPINEKFGRKFHIVSVRWLEADEI
jgi:hypothetical protein